MKNGALNIKNNYSNTPFFMPTRKNLSLLQRLIQSIISHLPRPNLEYCVTSSSVRMFSIKMGRVQSGRSWVKVNGPSGFHRTVRRQKIGLSWSKLDGPKRVKVDGPRNERSWSQKVNGPKGENWMVFWTKTGRSFRIKVDDPLEYWKFVSNGWKLKWFIFEWWFDCMFIVFPLILYSADVRTCTDRGGTWFVFLIRHFGML